MAQRLKRPLEQLTFGLVCLGAGPTTASIISEGQQMTRPKHVSFQSPVEVGIKGTWTESLILGFGLAVTGIWRNKPVDGRFSVSPTSLSNTLLLRQTKQNLKVASSVPPAALLSALTLLPSGSCHGGACPGDSRNSTTQAPSDACLPSAYS